MGKMAVEYEVRSFKTGDDSNQELLTGTWVAYTLTEGESFRMFGCKNKVEADKLVEEYKETGKIMDPFNYRNFNPNEMEKHYIEPVSLMVMQSEEIMHRLPVPKRIEEE